MSVRVRVRVRVRVWPVSSCVWDASCPCGHQIDGSGTTHGVPAVALAADVIATHTPALGGNILVFCDGCEYYGPSIATLKPVIVHRACWLFWLAVC